MYRKPFACLLYLLPILCSAQGTKLHFKHISIEQGLSNSTVESIFQDSRGFLWFGTRDGLNRYDGNQIVVFRFNEKDTTSISDSYINCIYEDHTGTLWIGTMSGLNAFDLTKNQFIRYKFDKKKRGAISYDRISSIWEDRKNNLWVGTFGGGLNLFHRWDNTFSSFRCSASPNSLSCDSVNAIFEDKKGNLWIGTERGIDRFVPEKQQFTFYKTPQTSSINRIAEDKEGQLWLGTEEKGLLRFDPQSGYFKQYQHQQTVSSSLSTNLIRSVIIDKKGNLWTGGVNGGLCLFNPATNSFFSYQNQRDTFSLSQRTVSALLEDKQGNYWVGTHRGGVNLYSPFTKKFLLYRQDEDKNSLSYSDVKSFCEDSRGNIWIATDGGGLDLFNRQKQSFCHFQHNPSDNGSISKNEVLDVTEDSEGCLWISTWGGGLNLLKEGSTHFEHFRNNPSDSASISSDFVQKTLEDHNKDLWVATYYGGLNLFNRKAKTFTHIEASPDGKSRLSGNNIVSLAEDLQGNIWIGTDDGGLNRYSPTAKTFDHYFNKEEKAPDLRVLFTDSKGRLWAGQRGLYLFNADKNNFSLFTTKGGLGTEFIKGIEDDAEGNLWISTSNGLTRFNPEKGTVRKYNISDGLQGLEFEANACMKAKDGELFFGGGNGFNSFYPEQIRLNAFIPPVVLTDFQIFNQQVLPSEKGPLRSDISVAKEIKLDYTQSTISLGFAALNFVASENNQYAYRLEGLEDDWHYVGTDHKATYNNLPPGIFTFRVKASNNDGIWNQQGTAIKIIITPPFWETWWFEGLMIFAFFTAIVAYYQYRKQQAIKKLKEKKREEMQQMQLQFFTNISHEFRTPLSLILGPLEKLKNESNEPAFIKYYGVMHRNVVRLLRLINELMDFRKAETGSLQLKVMPGNLTIFLHEITDEFTELAQEKKIQFNIHLPDCKEEFWFDRQVLEKIIINLLSNSFKYTPDEGRITVTILSSLKDYTPSFNNELLIENDYQAKRSIYLKVADSGIGISKSSLPHLFERYFRTTEAHMGSGIGLAFVKSLTTLHKGSIYVYSERNKGTEFIVSLPVDTGDYTNEEKWMRHTEKEVGLRMTHNGLKLHEEGENISLAQKSQSDDSPDKPSILIVEDNPELKSFLKDSLQPYYQVAEAKDGREGLQKAREIFPELIISDVMMPVMDGIEFCKRLKEDITISHTPFLMLTAKDALAARIEGVDSGADYYFSKPVSMELLLLTIRNIFTQKQKLKERYKHEYQVEARELVHTAKDKEFMDNLLTIIDGQLMNPELDVELLCTSIGMSRTKLYQKIKSITGQSIIDFVRTIRLRKAVEIMTHEDVPLGDVIFRVGIQTQSYFTKAFKKEFGKTPTQFLQEIEKQKIVKTN